MDPAAREITIRFLADDEETAEVEHDVRDALDAVFPVGALTVADARTLDPEYILVSRKAPQLRRGDRCPLRRPRRYENAAEIAYTQSGTGKVFVTYMDGQTLDYEPEQPVKIRREIRPPH